MALAEGGTHVPSQTTVVSTTLHGQGKPSKTTQTGIPFLSLGRTGVPEDEKGYDVKRTPTPSFLSTFLVHPRPTPTPKSLSCYPKHLGRDPSDRFKLPKSGVLVVLFTPGP